MFRPKWIGDRSKHLAILDFRVIRFRIEYNTAQEILIKEIESKLPCRESDVVALQYRHRFAKQSGIFETFWPFGFDPISLSASKEQCPAVGCHTREALRLLVLTEPRCPSRPKI